MSFRPMLILIRHRKQYAESCDVGAWKGHGGLDVMTPHVLSCPKVNHESISHRSVEHDTFDLWNLATSPSASVSRTSLLFGRGLFHGFWQSADSRCKVGRALVSEFPYADRPGVVAFTVGLVAEFCTFLPHDVMEWTLLTLGRFFRAL